MKHKEIDTSTICRLPTSAQMFALAVLSLGCFWVVLHPSVVQIYLPMSVFQRLLHP